MQSKTKRNVPSRRGVTFIEFVGCLAALGGGIVIGSIYLGVDVQAMAVGILEKADIEVPAILNAEASSGEESPADESAESNAPATDEPADLDPEGELSADDASTNNPPETKKLTEAEQRAATLACWTTLDQSVRAETTYRTKPINDPQSWELFDYLLHRKKGHQKVVEAIELLDKEGIDQRLRSHIEQVLAWQQAGFDLYERAAHLLTDAPAGKLSGPFAQSWQSAATQHRMEEKLILSKHLAVASYLEHTYKLPAEASPAN